MVVIAFERQDRVDDVLEHPRAGEGAVFRHVTDEHDRETALLRFSYESMRALTHLHHGAGRRAEVGIMHRLDRVDDHDIGTHGVEVADDMREVGLGRQPQARRERVEPLRPEADLLARLFRRHVEHPAPAVRHRRRHLREQRRLSDAGLTSEQRDRAGDEPARQHAIQLTDTRGPRLPLGHVDLVDGDGRLDQREGAGGRHRRLALLQCVPRAAGRALPRPLRRRRPARLAPKLHPRLRHATIVRRGYDSLDDAAERARNGRCEPASSRPSRGASRRLRRERANVRISTTGSSRTAPWQRRCR